MDLFKLFRSNKTEAPETPVNDYKFALACANGCNFFTRAGSDTSPYKLNETAVRVIVQDFGNYLPFVLGPNLQDWLKRTFNLSDREAKKVFKVLNMRAIQFLKTPPLQSEPGYLEKAKRFDSPYRSGDWFKLF